METVVQVLADEPVSPRRLLPKLPRDLETICMKCLQKAPSRRYASAAALADDLRRFLEDRPIQARPIHAWQRMIKWSRRRPTAAALIVVSFLALATLIGGGLWYNGRLQVAINQSQRNLTTAEQRLGIAHGAIYRMLERLADDLTPIPHTEPIRQKLLEDALEFYQVTVRQSATDPLGRELLGSAYAKIGDIQRLRGLVKEAEEAYRKSMEVSVPLAAEFPDNDEYANTLAATCNNLANLLKSQSRGVEAEEYYRRALKLFDPFLAAGNGDLQKQAGRTYNNLGILLAEQGKLTEAEATQRRSIELRQKLLDEHPGISDYAADLAVSYGNLANLAMQQKNYPQAVDAFRRADRAIRQVDERSLMPEHRSARAQRVNNYAALMELMDRNGEAEEAFRSAAAIAVKLVVEMPSIPSYRGVLAEIDFNLGRRLVLNKKRAAGVEVLRIALRLYDALATGFPEDASYRAGLAKCHHILGILGEDVPAAKPAILPKAAVPPQAANGPAK